MRHSNLFSTAIFCIVIVTACAKQEPPATAQAPAAKGQLQTAAALRAAPLVFINYWATWCGPCREEIPELNKFALQHKESVTVVAINFDGSSGDQLQQEIEEMGITFASTDLQTGEELQLTKPSVLPTTYVLQNGKLINTLLGPQTLQDLRAELPAADG